MWVQADTEHVQKVYNALFTFPTTDPLFYSLFTIYHFFILNSKRKMSVLASLSAFGPNPCKQIKEQ